MKALVIRQPWAELIVSGHKSIETRFRRTSMRDEFLIVAGKSIDFGAYIDPDILELLPRYGETKIARYPQPQGMAVGIARVYQVEPMRPELEAAALCKTLPGLFAWHLGNVRRIKSFAVRGMPGWFDVPLAVQPQ